MNRVKRLPLGWMGALGVTGGWLLLLAECIPVTATEPATNRESDRGISPIVRSSDPEFTETPQISSSPQILSPDAIAPLPSSPTSQPLPTVEGVAALLPLASDLPLREFAPTAEALSLEIESIPAIAPPENQQHKLGKEDFAKAKKKKNNANLPPFEQVTAETEKLEGVFTLYRDRETGKTYLEIQPDQLDQNFLAAISLESGIGDWALYSGWPIKTFVFQFRHVQDRVHFVVPNTYFRTAVGDPQQRSIDRSFSDSVLYSLTIQSIHPDRKSLLIDLNELLLEKGDLAGLADEFPWVLGEDYILDEEKSYLSDAKVFPLNAEIESVYGFSGGGNNWLYLESVPDARAFSLRVRYSFSALPTESNYQPRLADDRVGYFISAYQDFSDLNRKDPFKRYIWRWHLEKQDPELPLSPPKDPIVFWIENTVPKEYRDAIREGILMWNDAFAQIGFENAIEVQQMPDDAEWDPADIRYNTIRWSNSFDSGVLGLGPSRVNPINGQILDADIVLDASAVARYFRSTYGVLAEGNRNIASGQEFAVSQCGYGEKLPYLYRLAKQNQPLQEFLEKRWPRGRALAASSQGQTEKMCFGVEAAEQGAVGLLALSLLPGPSPIADEQRVYVQQFLRYLTAHEVGHTLGLRHNFRASTLLNPEELSDRGLTQQWGLVASVMDYVPVNLAPEGQPQGDYYPTVLGPYDLWAIEYGYKPIAAFNPREERSELQRIAQRASEPGLAYSPDEDSYNSLDPTANRWDLSNDVLRYSQWQMDNARRMWQSLEQRYPLPGESYSELRDRFNIIFSHYTRNAAKLPRYIGGQTFNRDRPSNPGGRLPFVPIPVTKQRQALAVLQRYIFSADAFSDISPALLKQLAPSRWMHWGSDPQFSSLEYPFYDRILNFQSSILGDLLAADRLARLRDAEMLAGPGDALTMAELFDGVQQGIWTEVMQPTAARQISALRRGLQHQYTNMLIQMVLRDGDAFQTATSFPEMMLALEAFQAPEDARVLARYKLGQLKATIAAKLNASPGLDTMTRAHLEATRDRIDKALNAPLQSQ